jgi:hypothetical protein
MLPRSFPLLLWIDAHEFEAAGAPKREVIRTSVQQLASLGASD